MKKNVEKKEIRKRKNVIRNKKLLLLVFLILTGCGNDISLNASRCPVQAYINYEVTSSICSEPSHYNMQPFYNDHIERMEPYITEAWLLSEVKNGKNPFYTHCDTLDVYQRCIVVDTLYTEICD